MTHVSQLIEGFVKPENEQDKELIESLLSTHLATSSLFLEWPLRKIMDEPIHQLNLLAEDFPKEGDTLESRENTEREIKFYTDFMRTILIMHENYTAIRRQEDTRSNLKSVNEHLERMFQNSAKLINENAN